jgi:L-rhamnose-H+ transport protein
MSACFSYGLAAGEPIKMITLRHGTPPLWQGLPVLVVVLLGGCTTNAVWCLLLNVRNKTHGEYFRTVVERIDPASNPSLGHSVIDLHTGRVPLLSNYLFCILAGATWYFQFFFYTMGETQMGSYRFSSWTLHMASIMIFGSLWGLALKEWRGASRRTMRLLGLSLAILIASVIIVGYGNYLGTRSG